MTTSLVAICCECKKIRIGDSTWIGEGHPYYLLLLQRPGLSEGYCPECTEKHQREVKERKQRINALGY